MVTKLFLLTCALTVSQPLDRSTWLLRPQLSRGQELVYSGTFTEEAQTPGVHFQRSYRLALNVCVLDAGPTQAQVAFLTVLSLRANRPEFESSTGPTSVRLEVTEVDEHGRVRGRPGTNLSIPLEAPPTVECGAFIEAPSQRVGIGQFWEVAEQGRPPRTWRVSGTGAIGGANCVILSGDQQSDDWNIPRGDRGAWRRRDTVWLAPQLGVAYRVERVVERRDPAREAPTHRVILRYDLDTRMTYPGDLFAARRQEILQAQKFFEEAAPLLRQPSQQRGPIEAELKRIAHHLDAQPPTPYRQAILQIQRRLEAARRGEITPVATVEDAAPQPQVATVGRPVPDFVATNLLTGQSARLQRLLGRPLLLCFYNPHTATGATVLGFAQGLCERHGGKISVVAMAIGDDVQEVRKQHAELRLPFPVLDGSGLHVTYGVDATPRLVLVDAGGIVRGLYTGWGAHSSREINEELQRWLPK
jgi:peroxiredoxin